MIRRPPRSTRTDTLLPYTTLFRSDGIGVAEDLQALVGDLADDPDAEARAGEQLPPHDRLGQTELEADLAELVLEAGAPGLDPLQLQMVGHPTAVVVALAVGSVGDATRLADRVADLTLPEDP